MSQQASSVGLAALSTSFLLVALALSAVLCVPSQTQQQVATKPSATTSTTTSASPSTTTAGSTTSTTPAAPLGARQPTKRPAEASKPLAFIEPASEAEQYASFDGQNAFGDASLWQIPIQLVRDLSASSSSREANSEVLAKSASEASGAQSRASRHHFDEPLSLVSEADEEEEETAGDYRQPLGSSAPTVISASTGADLKTAAGYNHATPHHYNGGKYFQYASVPYPYAWEFGYRRGNPYHTIERYEHGKGPHFQTKVKWSDKAGYGVHVWDYNHDDHHNHHDYDHHKGHYDSHQHAPAHHNHHYGAHN